ncbi:acetylornithine deacetylase [Albirhodobacter sp. R86504]|uniref:acetylornithine deacetylase n=1 Tax=Albirhodobacter sp. R86504 TaxID=3093848 RepID=UPI003672EDC4
MTSPSFSKQDTALGRATTYLNALIAYNTVSHRSNRAIIEYLQDHLQGLGADIVLLPDRTGEKLNLIARFGPADACGIVFSGHTDVVPANEAGWLTDPFVMDTRNERLYGRGACDMKGFLACVLAVADTLDASKLRRPLYMCFSYDEEIGCLGAPDIARYLAALEVPPELAIIGEPSLMKLVTGQKGKIAMRGHARGTTGHSSFAPDHVNAIEYAARAIGMIADHALAYREHGPFDPEFTVPHATMLTLLAQGGVATNVTPGECQFTFELRSLSGMDAQGDIRSLTAKIDRRLGAAMAEIAQDAGFTWDQIFAYPAMGDARATAGFARYAGVMPDWGGKVSYGSEGGVFETIGKIPSVIIGPGSIGQAHKPNEYVETAQLHECIKFLTRMTDALSHPQG